MDDRRSKPRLEVRLNAMWEGGNEAHVAHVTNLSEDGCYIDSVGEIRRGEIVAFRVLLPDQDWLYLEGEVRHHGLSGFGVQFVDLNEEQKEKLAWLLRLAKEAGSQNVPMSVDLVED
jgi:hypothetical protein